MLRAPNSGLMVMPDSFVNAACAATTASSSDVSWTDAAIASTLRERSRASPGSHFCSTRQWRHMPTIT